MIIISSIGALVQLIAFALIPFIVYLIGHKTIKGFFNYIGLFPASYSSISRAVIFGLVIGAAGIAVMYTCPEIRHTAAGKGTVPEQIGQINSNGVKIILILIIAFVKTALAEEVLFRGFAAKRLIAWMGYKTGNLIQAVLFGVLHVLLFLSVPGVSPVFLGFSFLLPGTAGYLAGHLNEKVGNGSIYPGWIVHGLGNLISFSFLAFL